MTDLLSQERWSWNMTCVATQTEAPSVASPQQQFSLTRRATSACSPYSESMERGVSEPLSSVPIPHILVIDDSVTVRKIMEVTHRRQGVSLQTFSNGVEALQWLHRHPTVLPMLIYLDISMPYLDGYDVARHLHGLPHLSAVPIIMLSGRDGMLDRLKGRLAGATGYITKPFRSEEILRETWRYLRPCKPASRLPERDQHCNARDAVLIDRGIHRL